MAVINLKLIKEDAKKAIDSVQDLTSLNEAFKKYLGEKGELTKVLRSLGKRPAKSRELIGKSANDLKNMLRSEFERKSREIKAKVQKEVEEKEWIDITVPGKKPSFGHLHPLTQIRRKCEEVFESMGFSIEEGPEIENEWYNFEALNIPKDHPARDMWDTFWLHQNERKTSVSAQASADRRKSKLKNGRLLLRTHTSPVQVRYMEKNKPPLRIIVPGKIFRHEATDASHDFQFHHLEGLMVGKDISVANFKAILQEFMRRFFRRPLEIRLRPSFFPFTEPSFEIDISCLVCSGKGCPVCKEAGWVEMMGAGMVHPHVYSSSGINPKEFTGFAFGLGLDRLAMMKYKIGDIRLFHGGDLRFLEQF